MSRFVLRAAASLLLLASAGMFVAASAQRWWPACRRGEFDTDACLRLQGHVHDHVHVSEPWVPVGSATTYPGVALFLLAGAVAVLPFVLAAGVPRLQVPVAVVAAGSIAVLGVHAWTSGTTGRVAPITVDPLAWGVWALVLPPLLIVWARWQRGGWAAATAAALVVSTPVPALLLGMVALGYTSHDTAPWSDAVVAVPLAAAAVLLWKIEPRAAVRPARPPVVALGLLTRPPVRAQHVPHD